LVAAAAVFLFAGMRGFVLVMGSGEIVACRHSTAGTGRSGDPSVE